MMQTTPNLAAALAPLALIILGMFLGVLILVVILAIVALVVITLVQRRETIAARELLARTLARNTTVITNLQREVTLSLSRMDVDRMHDASVAIQQTTKSLSSVATHLKKLLFTQPGDAGTVDQFGISNDGLLGSDLNDEAMQDAAQVDQWQARRVGMDYDGSRSGSGSAGGWSAGVGAASAPSSVQAIFGRWQADQAAKEAARMGADSPIPIQTLPDLADAHDLDAQEGSDQFETLGGVNQVPEPPGFTDL